MKTLIILLRDGPLHPPTRPHKPCSNSDVCTQGAHDHCRFLRSVCESVTLELESQSQRDRHEVWTQRGLPDSGQGQHERILTDSDMLPIFCRLTLSPHINSTSSLAEQILGPLSLLPSLPPLFISFLLTLCLGLQFGVN